MTDRMTLTDPVLRVVYMVLPSGHRALAEVDLAREVNQRGRLSLDEAREIGVLLEALCCTGDAIVSMAALHAAHEQYVRALDALDDVSEQGVVLCRWNPEIDGPEPKFTSGDADDDLPPLDL